ncbi:3-oxoacyl-[acyl-carrier-protein] reductase FabG-like [Branchiostoma floridae]|uniref:3-oxoacyl-[acyl-carrier-protein] reductase FabG-like n=1 Tax=Branchiostoma floridae TaxID=7739 RepID=A0A9J7HFS9_BRAFL|nr:3-oxoacyl-[acyl-carrier-protein] reductase FabG-like [Branchiostoma floridae]
MPDLGGKVAIITGASSGIGQGTAVEFAQLGAHLALTGRNQENLQATAKACVEAGTPQDKVLLITGDICDEELRKNLVDQTVQKFGRIDVLVNNAGTAHLATIETTDMAEYDKLMNVNVRSVVALTQLCVPHLTVTKGSIVNVSSVNGLRAIPGLLASNMSKAALDQFTRCVALELASKQIRVNSVNLGAFPTQILKRMSGLDDEGVAQMLEHMKSLHALGRNGEVSEVARTIAFLASSDASFITGAQVPVDGGWHLKCPR